MISTTVKKLRKWEFMSCIFNDSFKFTGDISKDKTKLAGKLGNLQKELKQEKNPIRAKAIEEVIKIVRSMMI